MIGRLLRDRQGNWLLPPRWCEAVCMGPNAPAIYEVTPIGGGTPFLTDEVEIIPDDQVPDRVWVELAKRRLTE